MHKIIRTVFLILSLVTIISACKSVSNTNDYNLTHLDLVWSDEFDSTEVNRTNWTFEIGGHGWGNNELEYYTDHPQNAYIENGNLVIQAIKETNNGNDYTSARLVTQGKQEFQYGRIEARIKLPTGKGIWPAFWMLGGDISTAGWPQCGEIDIMEHLGSELTTAHGTLHGPGYYGGGGIGVDYKLEDGQFKDDFHIFAIEWIPGQIQWFIDGNLFHTVTENDIPQNAEWVFDQPFFIILNLAVGGNWPGSPNENTVFPQQMLVDYVRVYQADSYPSLADTAESMLQAGIPVKMHISQIDLSAQEKGNAWVGKADVKVVDEFGNPVKGVTITGKWSGEMISKKEFKAKTNAEGLLESIQSPRASQDGKLFFCIETVAKDGYILDVSAAGSGCETIEH